MNSIRYTRFIVHFNFSILFLYQHLVHLYLVLNCSSIVYLLQYCSGQGGISATYLFTLYLLAIQTPNTPLFSMSPHLYFDDKWNSFNKNTTCETVSSAPHIHWMENFIQNFAYTWEGHKTNQYIVQKWETTLSWHRCTYHVKIKICV